MKRWLKGLLPWFFLFLMVGLPLTGHAKTVTLSWDASPSNVAGYRVCHSLTETMIDPICLPVGNILMYQIVDLPNGDGHYFGVNAYDDQGNESVYSNIVYSPPVGDAPGVIQDFRFEVR